MMRVWMTLTDESRPRGGFVQQKPWYIIIVPAAEPYTHQYHGFWEDEALGASHFVR